MDARTFLAALYPEIPSGSSVVIWSRRRTRWCGSVDEAAVAAGEFDQSSDVYFGACLQNRDAAVAEARERAGANVSEEHARGTPRSATHAGGVWIDIDVAGAGHQNQHYAPTIAAAIDLLGSVPIRPSIVLGTGGGIHAWWLLREPVDFSEGDERERFGRLVAGIQERIRRTARERGFGVDSTHDLARVMRVAGTRNHKHSPPRPVQTLLGNSGEIPRCNPSELAEWIVEPERARAVTVTGAASEYDFVLNSEAAPPPDKLRVCLEMVPRFRSTWNRERTDFPSGNATQSEYDLALASIAAHLGWRDQEIIDLLVAHRRNGGLPPKLRPDYYARTLARGRAGLDPAMARARLEADSDTVRAPAVDTPAEATTERPRARVIEDVSTLLGLDVRRVVRFVGDPPTYRVWIGERSISVGSVETLLSPRKFRAIVADLAGQVIRSFKQADWDPVAQALLRACEDQDLGDQSTPEGSVGELLAAYLAAHKVCGNLNEAITLRQPTMHNGRVVVFLDDLRRWLRVERDERSGPKELARRLRSAGCSPVVLGHRRDDGTRTTALAWGMATHAIDTTNGPFYMGSNTRDEFSELNT